MRTFLSHSGTIDRATRASLWVAGVYLMVSLAWIVFSDRAVEMLPLGPEQAAWLQTLKGGVFVIATSVLLFAICWRRFFRVYQAESQLQHAASHDELTGLSVVAEGVETAGQLNQLRQMRCDAIQSYYFGKPMEANTAGNWLAGHAAEHETAAPVPLSPSKGTVTARPECS